MNTRQKIATFALCFVALLFLASLSSAYTYDWNYGPWGDKSSYTYKETKTISESHSTSIKDDDYYKSQSYQKTEKTVIEEKKYKDNSYRDNSYNERYKPRSTEFKPSKVYIYTPSDYRDSYRECLNRDCSKYYDYRYECSGTSGRCNYYDYDYYGYPSSNWRYKETYHWYDYRYGRNETYTDDYYYNAKPDWHLGYYNWNY